MINKALLKAEAEKIGIFLDDTALERLDKYADLLVETNKSLNLTAITDPDEIVYKHFIDSLSLLTCVEIKNGAKVIDVGTGAGFPGVVLLIARPDLKITLLDGTNKRLVFIKNVLDEIGLEAEIVHMRAELAGKDIKYREKFDLVTARAVANLNTLAEYCMPFVRKGGVFAAMKGPNEDAGNAENAVKILGGDGIAVYDYLLGKDDKRKIFSVKKLSHTPTKYPRNSSQIKNKAL